MLAACASAPSGRELETRAKGDLAIYVEAGEDVTYVMVDAFRRANPEISVTLFKHNPSLPTSTVFGDLVAQKPDIYVNMDVTGISSNEGLFEARNTDLMARVPKNLRSANGAWTTVAIRPYVLIYNTNTLQSSDVPKSLTDLTQAKWKSKVAIIDSSNSLLLSNISMLRQEMGDARAQQFARELVNNGTQWVKEHRDVVNAVKDGRALIGLVSLSEATKGIRAGAPLGYQYLEMNGNILSDTINVAISKKSTNLRNARLFADFVLSSPAQQSIADTNLDVPVMLGVQMAQGMKPLSLLKITPVAFKELAAHATNTRELLARAGIP